MHVGFCCFLFVFMSVWCLYVRICLFVCLIKENSIYHHTSVIHHKEKTNTYKCLVIFIQTTAAHSCQHLPGLWSGAETWMCLCDNCSSHTNTHEQTHLHNFPNCSSHTHTHTYTHTPCSSHTHAHTHKHTLTLSLSLGHTHTH